MREGWCGVWMGEGGREGWVEVGGCCFCAWLSASPDSLANIAWRCGLIRSMCMASGPGGVAGRLRSAGHGGFSLFHSFGPVVEDQERDEQRIHDTIASGR